MSFFSKNFSAAVLAIVSLLGTVQASASYMGSKTDGGIVYSLYSTPNKILRYDMAAEANLTSTPLGKVPTAFTVANGIAYVAFGRELRSINVSTGAEVFIRNTSADISHILAIGENLFIMDQSGIATLISRTDFHLVDNPDNTFDSDSFFAASDNQSAIYYIAPNSQHISKLNIGSDGKVASSIEGPYSPYSPANKLFLNTSQNKIYTQSGSIAFATLIAAGSLHQPFDSITFIDDNPIIVVDNTLKIFTTFNTFKGEIALASKPIFSASHGQKVFTFSESGNELFVTVNDLSQFKLPAFGQLINPLDFAYTPEFYEADEEGNIYAIDKETLSIFRWSTTKNTYLATWPLTSPPTSVTYSAAHKRLYLGYPDGKITYISTTETIPSQHPFATLTFSAYRLLAVGQVLLVTDQPYSWQTESTLDINGNLTNLNIENFSSEQYFWNPANNRLYRSGVNVYMPWSELNPATGAVIKNSAANYGGTKSIIASNGNQYLLSSDGQILDAYSLNLFNSLSNSVSDGAWIDGNLITIATAPLSVQFWGLNYEKLFSYPLHNAISARLLTSNGKLVLILQRSTGPSFTLFDPNQLPDTDGDGSNDFKDNCNNIANNDQVNFDGDDQGDVCDSDDDNDGISDNKEISVNLNPLNASDAQADLDKDGFSNSVELLMETSIGDMNSAPKAMMNYFESFENGWPVGFFNGTDRAPWTIQSLGVSRSQSIVSSAFISNDSTSELNFSAFFNTGLFSFKYRLQTESQVSNEYRVALFVDGIILSDRYLSSDEGDWQTISVGLSYGMHKISIRLIDSQSRTTGTMIRLAIDDIKFESNPDNDDTDGDGFGKKFDNCPSISNDKQIDIDADGYGDAFDMSDDRPIDTDFDGTLDREDNCPLVMNSQNDNRDYDNLGDACDPDIDGDGIANDVEKTFSFMDEKNHTDIQKDQDGDGVSNGNEIANGTNPGIADVFPTISLFDYYPLGEIKISARNSAGDTFITEYMKRLSAKNTYETISTYSRSEFAEPDDDDAVRRIERKDSGIYLTQTNYVFFNSDPNTDKYIGVHVITNYTNNLILPAAMKMGEIITVKGTSTQTDAGGEYNEKITIRFELIKTGHTNWKGTSYPSVTIRRSGITELDQSDYDPYTYIEEVTYLKGIGKIEDGIFSYEKIDIISQDLPHAVTPVTEPGPVTEPTPTAEPTIGKKKSGGGAMDIWFLISLVLSTAMASRKRFSS